ncbi:MAG: hypothetical protein ACD_11C00103G0046 [uncultured bacterium]|nr:MAG: hypothetical protein ACD_11C00103G0046 [uncultured bacterium]
MFFSVRKNRDKKEFEYEKIRTLSKKKEKFAFFRAFYIFFYYLLSVSFLGVFFYVLFFSPFLAVEQIEISGIQELNLENVSKVSESVYEGKYLGFIPKKNLLIFPSGKIKKALLDSFKKIKSISIEKKFPNFVEIKIQERKSLVIWCEGERCFIVDENGDAFEEVKLDSREVLENNLIKIVSGNVKNIAEGEKILEVEKVDFLNNFKDVLQKNSPIKFSDEVYMQSHMAEEVILKTSQGWNVHISILIPLEKSANALKLFLDKEITSEDLGRLEYVDLRIENKIFYKFRDEEKKEGEEEKTKQNEQAGEEEIKNKETV